MGRSLLADAPSKVQGALAAGVAAVLLSVAPAHAGVILEQPQIKKVRRMVASEAESQLPFQLITYERCREQKQNSDYTAPKDRRGMIIWLETI